MSKSLKIFLIVLSALLLGALVPPVFMPSKFIADSSIVIKSNAYNVFPYVADLKNWEKWTSWKKKDPTTNFKYAEKTFGAGSSMEWDSKNPNVGTGKLTTVQFKKFHHLNYKFEMTKPGSMKSSGQITLENINDSEVKVTWTDQGELKYPFDRWVNCFVHFEEIIEKDFAEGLANLKQVVESSPQRVLPKVQPETVQLSDQYIFSIVHETVRNTELGNTIGASYKAIKKTLEQKKIEPLQQPPICIFYRHNSLTSKIRPGLFVGGCSGVDLENGVECIPVYGDKVLRFTYTGGYGGMQSTYDAIEIYIEENKISRKRDFTWESYVTDPGLEPDSNKWVTQIFVPIK
jgi:effector-binding domain-containing protein